MEKYARHGRVVKGRYGEVYRAMNTETGAFVTVKEYNPDGHRYGMREIEVYDELPNTINVVLKILGHEWKNHGEILCLIFEERPSLIRLREHLDSLVPNAIHQQISDPLPTEVMSMLEIKGLLYRLLSAVEVCHSSKIIHRAEMTNGRPLVERVWTDRGQLRAIFRVLGLPSIHERTIIPGVKDFLWNDYKDIPVVPINALAALVPRLDPEGVDLLSKMLEWVPANRITTQQALNHSFFRDVVGNQL